MSVRLDKQIVCTSCNKDWNYPVKDQLFFESKGFCEPKTCRDCREKRKAGAPQMGKKSGYSSAAPYSGGSQDRDSYQAPAGSKRRPEEEGGGGGGNRYHAGDNNGSAKRPRNDNYVSASASGGVETDKHRVEQRLKQIQYGYNSVAYDRYIAEVPKEKRRGIEEHPRTPDPYLNQSKRAFDGRCSKWRRDLHKWDIPDGAVGETSSPSSAPLAANKPPVASARAPISREAGAGVNASTGEAPATATATATAAIAVSAAADCGEVPQASYGEACEADIGAAESGSDDDDVL